VKAGSVVPVEATPEQLPPEQVAVSTDAVLTSYHALKTADIKEGETVLIIGVGGLGSNAVQIAKVGIQCNSSYADVLYLS
jgi:alcohol dehydrogenase, propanol-preferring